MEMDDSSQNRSSNNIQSQFNEARLPQHVAPNGDSSTFISESPVSEQQQNVESDHEYALRLQQQFDAMSTGEAHNNRHDHGRSSSHSNHSNNSSYDFNPYHPLPQDPDTGDVVTISSTFHFQSN